MFILQKFAELGAAIILIHFVLELRPVLILLDRETTVAEQLSKMRRYKVLYICSISFACLYSIA